MLNALLIGNLTSGSARRLNQANVPGRWILDPATVTAEDVRESDLVALFGGDGTVQITLTQILRVLPADQFPPIAVLPFGTTNMSAMALNQTRSRPSAVGRLKRAIETGQLNIQNRSMVRVASDTEVEYGFFFGAGAIAQVVERWNQQRKPGALINQLRSLQAMVTGLRAASAHFNVLLNGQSLSIYGLLATTLDRLLFGSRPFWGESEPGSLRLTWVESNAAHLLRHAPALLRGSRHLEKVPGYESLAVESATLELTGPYIIDGEIFQADNKTLVVSRSEPLRWITL